MVPPEKMTAVQATALAAAALREWEDDDDPELRDARMDDLETFLNNGNALEILRRLPADLRNFALGVPAFRKWSSAQPRVAARWLSSLDGVSETRVWTLVADWRARAPQDFEKYLAELPPGEWNQMITAAACNQVLADDPWQAIDWARQMEPDARQTGVLELAAGEWVKIDAAGASRWLFDVKDPELHARLLATMSAASASANPPVAH